MASNTSYVNQKQLQYLAENCPTASFYKMSNELGYNYNKAHGILEKHKNNYRDALFEILNGWNNKMEGKGKCVTLMTAMKKSDIGGLIPDIEKLME